MVGLSSVGSALFRVNLREPSWSRPASTEGAPGLGAGGGDAVATDASDGSRALNSEQRREVEALEARDREVRTHEQAHIAASGELATAGPFYEYDTGPDGRRYVVDGEVSIRAPRKTDPEETIRVQEQLIRAALAPAQPSAQDRRVAAGARQKIARAQAELGREGGPGASVGPGRDADGAPDSLEPADAGMAERLEGSAFNDRALARYVSVATAA